MKTRHLLLLASGLSLSGCVPYPVRNTPPVRGQVVDARTHRPVSGVRVNFPDSRSLGTTTDTRGRFSLAEGRKFGFVVLGPFDALWREVPLEVNGTGYQLFRAQVPFRAPDEPVSLKVALEPAR